MRIWLTWLTLRPPVAPIRDRSWSGGSRTKSTLTRQQGRDPRRRVGDRGVDHLLDVGLRVGHPPAPPGVVALQDGADAGIPLRQDERAGAVGVADRVGLLGLLVVLRLLDLVLLRPLLVHDADRGDLVGQDRVRALGDDLDGVIVDLADLLDRVDVVLEIRGLAERPAQREYHVVCRERLALVERHPGAELELPDVRLDRAPRHRQARNLGQRRVAVDQAVVDLRVHGAGRTLVLGVRVHGESVALAGPAQGLGVGGTGERGRNRETGAQRVSGEFHRESP